MSLRNATLNAMKTVTIRDLRTRPKTSAASLEREREAVLTANGRPVAVLIPWMRGASRRRSRRCAAREGSRRCAPSDGRAASGAWTGSRLRTSTPSSRGPAAAGLGPADESRPRHQRAGVGAPLRHRPPAWIVEAVLAGELELALDMAIREEYEDVLRRPSSGSRPLRSTASWEPSTGSPSWRPPSRPARSRCPTRTTSPFWPSPRRPAASSSPATSSTSAAEPTRGPGADARDFVDRLR